MASTVSTPTRERRRTSCSSIPGVGFNGAGWSRDGSSIFYITYGLDKAASGQRSASQNVIRLDLESGRTRVLDDSPGSKSDLALSRDGRWLAYRAEIPKAAQGQMKSWLRLLSVDGGAPRDLFGDAAVHVAGYRGINWTPDDRFLIFAVGQFKDGKP